VQTKTGLISRACSTGPTPNMKNPLGTRSARARDLGLGQPRRASPVYDRAGNPQPLQVAIPAPASAGPGRRRGGRTGQSVQTLDPYSTEFVISKNEKSGTAFFVSQRGRHDRGLERTSTKAKQSSRVDRLHRDRTAPADVGANSKGLTLVSTPKARFILRERASASGRSDGLKSLQLRQQLH